MKLRAYIAGVVATGLVIGWFTPGPSGTPAPVAATAGRDEPTQAEMMQFDQWGAGEVVLAREGDGHFYADVEAEGATARMLVDTGASMVALTAEDADAFGVEWDPDAVQPVARGASGPVYGVHATIGRIQLGQLEVENVEAIVVPDGLGISLLGQSFLSQIERVEMDRDRMILGG